MENRENSESRNNPLNFKSETIEKSNNDNNTHPKETKDINKRPQTSKVNYKKPKIFSNFCSVFSMDEPLKL